MLYLLWGLLNIGLFIYFIFICFNATKFIRGKLGIVASIVFVFGLLSFIGNSNFDSDNKEQGLNQVKTWQFISPDSLDKSSVVFLQIDFEKTLISKYCLGIQYGKDKQLKNNIPISAVTWTTGFESGTSWKPISIIVTRTDDNGKFEYEIEGMVKWKLLGLTIYDQTKTWKGVALIK